MKKRCALYARCSTSDKQDPAMQLSELRQFAEARGWEIVDEYVDAGFSGKNTNRPMLKKLMTATDRREIDIVLTWKLDRFARSLGDLISLIQRLSDVGVEFVSFKDNLDLTTSQGRLMLHLIGAFAQFERDMIVSRVKAGLEHARKNGQKLGRPQKRNDDAIRSLRIKGMSLRKIAAKLGISKTAVHRGLECTENPVNLTAVTG